METGLVRSILGAHALGPGAPWDQDPNRLVEAFPLAAELRALEGREGAAAVTARADAYVQLWARTFRTLVRHLRGRPERALALFVSEVYPFLRGDRLAARLETASTGRATILVTHDLPDAYLAGLIAGFVRLSGASAECVGNGNGHFEVRYRVAARDRLARLAQNLASLRVPLLVCAAASALLGIAIAERLAGSLVLWRIAATLVGAVAVQLGANALHELRNPHPAGPLSPVRLTRRTLQSSAGIGYAIAGGLGIILALAQPIVLAFAAAGLLLSLLFRRFRNAGWGPLLAGLTYPLLALGALHAAAPTLVPSLRLDGLLTLPLGAAAAALLHLDDMADSPLDEAGGQRTLAVRLPGRSQVVTFAILALVAAAGASIIALSRALPVHATLVVDGRLIATGVAALLTLIAAAALIRTVIARLDDPARLGGARLGTLALLLATAALSIFGAMP